jgi:hypothetical protein
VIDLQLGGALGRIDGLRVIAPYSMRPKTSAHFEVRRSTTIPSALVVTMTRRLQIRHFERGAEQYAVQGAIARKEIDGRSHGGFLLSCAVADVGLLRGHRHARRHGLDRHVNNWDLGLDVAFSNAGFGAKLLEPFFGLDAKTQLLSKQLILA